MNVTVHFPKDEKDREVLSNNLAKVYGNGVKYYIHNLNCTKEQKLRLLDELIKSQKSIN